MLDKIEQRIVDDIEKFGWHMIAVQPGEDDPQFTYTIGLMHTLQHPELVIVGLEDRTASAILKIISDEIRGGRLFSGPGQYEGIMEKFACRMSVVSEQSHAPYLGYAMWHRRYVGKVGTLRAMQCLWPDKAGIFPGEPGCDPHIVKLQRVF